MITAVLAVLLWLSPEVSERIAYVVAQLIENGYSQQEAESLFRDSRLQAYPPRELRPREIDWDKMIAQLTQPASVQLGKEFLAQHAESLRQAESQFGVGKAELVALFRLESNFGRNSGSYTVFNVFYTRLVQSEEERRWKWAAENLIALASFCRMTGEDCFQVKGSYGGALGPAQFLPASVMAFGLDGNGDSRVDPFDMTDALLSAANFLKQHGWNESPAVALGKYYGSSVGYPDVVLAYAAALKR